jgi:hypothetical protein
MPIMRKRIQMILFPAALTLTLASCGRQIFMPAETPDTGAPVSTAADKDSLYVDPYLAGLTQGRLAWFMEQALGAVPVDTLPLSLHLSGANSQTVTPYAGYPAFTITVTAAPGSPLNGPVFLEVPHWQGDLQDHPDFGFINVFNTSAGNLKLRAPATITTSTFWPWMSSGSTVCKFRSRQQETPRRYLAYEFARVAAGAPQAVSLVAMIPSGTNRPQPFRDETIVYEEEEGD